MKKKEKNWMGNITCNIWSFWGRSQ